MSMGGVKKMQMQGAPLCVGVMSNGAALCSVIPLEVILHQIEHHLGSAFFPIVMHGYVDPRCACLQFWL